MSPITTSYGTWNNHGDRLALTVEQTVEEAFGSEGPAGFDVDSIVSEYRDAINDALPDGVTLTGNEFIGPAYRTDETWGPEAKNEDGELDIKTIVVGIDLGSIIERYGPKED